jgi:TRAP-type C4-dicarboxylate transport system permease small subunit
MKPKTVTGSITQRVYNIIKSLGLIGCIFFGIMAFVVIVNVIGRFFFQRPLKGTVELVEITMIIVAFFAIPYTARERGHVRVTLVVTRFSKRVQDIVRSIGYFLSAVIIGIITYQAIVETIYYMRHLKETTPILFIPLAPFRLIMALGCFMLCIQLLLDTVRPTQNAEGREGDVEK